MASAINIQLVQVASGLNNPLLVTHAGDGSGRRFVVEQNGRIRIIDIGGAVLPADFINLGPGGLAKTQSGGEQGLLGLAFHPNYASNGYFYVNYTRTSDGATMVARYSASAGDPNVADTTETVILGPITQPQPNHNGGMMAFGPDGYLYVALGDGGGANDQGPGHNPTLGNGQDLNTLLGKMLRIDVDNPAGGNNYGIPPSNPFASGGGLPEIYAYGLRNPWRFSFDRLTGELYCADVGQNTIEEIDLIVSGGNFGWRGMEGSNCFDISVGCSVPPMILPIFEYDHSQGCSITGGYVYRGSLYPAIDGYYFYGDYCNGRIWSLHQPTPGNYVNQLQLSASFNISSFGEDEAGELYVCGYGNGIVYRLIDADPQPTPNSTRGWDLYD
jgi:glucose/arabinose dehydrogenase